VLFRSIVSYVDFFGQSYYADTVTRRTLGMGFTYPLTDASMYLITTKGKSAIANSLWAFATPFFPSLWGGIMLVLISSAFLDYFMGGHPHGSFSAYLYYTLMLITTKSKSAPLHVKSKFLNFGLGFFTFVITAAYIANLSSVLITKTLEVPKYTDIDDANNRRARVCVEKGSYYQTVLTQYYPGIRVVPVGMDTTAGIATGKCDAAVLTQVTWDLYSESVASNPSCNYVQVGGVIRIVNGAWPYKVDYNDKCTSFVNDVFTAILVDMYSSGAIDSIYEEAVTKSFNVTCSFEPPEEKKASLRYENVGGVFIIYIITVSSGVILHTSNLLYNHIKMRSKTLGRRDPGSRRDMPRALPYLAKKDAKVGMQLI